MTDYNAPGCDPLSLAIDTHEWENKAARPAAYEADDAQNKLLYAFEAFKQTNDQRLDEIECRMSADIVTTDKLDRINRALDDYKSTVDQLVLKSARPQRGGAGHSGTLASEHKSAFETYMRRGESGNLRHIEQKALSASSDPDGGYFVPEEIETQVMRALNAASPIRSISSNRRISANTYKKPFTTTGAATGWVADGGSRAPTDTPILAELAFPTMELYAMPAATQTLLED
nr:phage major capsid protein [Hyphomicrobiales bacterium]